MSRTLRLVPPLWPFVVAVMLAFACMLSMPSRAASAGTETVLTIGPLSTTTAQKVSGTSATSSWQCTNNSNVHVRRTAPGGTDSGIGIGPFCSGEGCLGQTFIVPAQSFHVLAEDPGVYLFCSRLDGGAIHVAMSATPGVTSSYVSNNYVARVGDTMSGALVVNGAGGVTTAQVVSSSALTLRPSTGTVNFTDGGGNVDLLISSPSTSSGGTVVRWVDTATVLNATACDSIGELGQVIMFDKGTGASISLCACERHGTTIGWYPMSVGGECV